MTLSGANGATIGTATASSTILNDDGQTFTLTTGADTVAGGAFGDTINSTTNTLSANDQINGGGGVNVLNLTGAGVFNLKLPASFSNVQVINAQEGQAASVSGSTLIPATNQTVTLRDGSNATVNVASVAANPANPKPVTISIVGAHNAAVINLGGGNDVVTVGDVAETVNCGGGTDQIQVTAATIGAAIHGRTGPSALIVTGGGAIAMGPSVTNIAAVQLASTTSALSFMANGIAGLVVTDLNHGADTVSAGGPNQTLTGALRRRNVQRVQRRRHNLQGSGDRDQWRYDQQLSGDRKHDRHHRHQQHSPWLQPQSGSTRQLRHAERHRWHAQRFADIERGVRYREFPLRAR